MYSSPLRRTLGVEENELRYPPNVFDLVILRETLMYLDREDKAVILRKIKQMLRPLAEDMRSQWHKNLCTSETVGRIIQDGGKMYTTNTLGTWEWRWTEYTTVWYILRVMSLNNLALWRLCHHHHSKSFIISFTFCPQELSIMSPRPAGIYDFCGNTWSFDVSKCVCFFWIPEGSIGS